MNMTVSTNVSMASNTKDGKRTMTKTGENGNTSARVAGSDKDEEQTRNMGIKTDAGVAVRIQNHDDKTQDSNVGR